MTGIEILTGREVAATGALSVAAAVTSALSAAERSYLTSEVGAEAWRTPCPKGSGQEELPHV